MPAKTPLRHEHWVTDQSVVLLGDNLRCLALDKEDVCDSSDSDCLNADFTVCGIVSNPPVLSGSQLIESADKCLRLVLVHEVGMRAVHVGRRQVASLDGCRDVLRPHAVDAVLVEEVEAGALAETKDAVEQLSGFGGSMDLNPVKVVIEDHRVDSEVLRGVGISSNEHSCEGAC